MTADIEGKERRMKYFKISPVTCQLFFKPVCFAFDIVQLPKQ